MSYVPAAAIVCRTAALRGVGGFAEELRWGEDVDLVWRLVEAGWRCRYEPAVVVTHRARPAVGAWLRQQYEYGTSAAPLARRHPGALAPLRISGWTLAAWGLVALRRPFAAVVLTAGTAVALQRKLRGVPPAVSTDLVVRGTLAAGEQLAGATSRTWWPLAVALLGVRRTRPAVVAALVAPAVLGAWRARSSRPTRSVVMRLAGDAAYGAGVWRGAARTLARCAHARPGQLAATPRGPAATSSRVTDVQPTRERGAARRNARSLCAHARPGQLAAAPSPARAQA